MIVNPTEVLEQGRAFTPPPTCHFHNIHYTLLDRSLIRLQGGGRRTSAYKGRGCGENQCERASMEFH